MILYSAICELKNQYCIYKRYIKDYYDSTFYNDNGDFVIYAGADKYIEYANEAMKRITELLEKIEELKKEQIKEEELKKEGK